MANARSTIESIRTQILNNMVRSESRHDFLPDSSLNTILTEKSVENAVEELNCRPDEKVGLAKRVFREGRKVFAILIWMKEEDQISTFRDRDSLDSRLPLHESYAEQIAPRFGIEFSRHVQWMFLPFVFSADMVENHRNIDDNRILPFITNGQDVGRGSFGDVFKVGIHPSQQTLLATGTGSTKDCVHIIRKTLRRKGITRDFINERMCLRLLTQLRDPNIVPLLGSYTHQEQHNFLFPCYEMDLRTFFLRESRYCNFKWDFTFFSALRGLSSALMKTHSLKLSREAHGIDFEAIGYHHDIRPANILVSEQTFILSDFGLGNLKPLEKGSTTEWKNTMGDFLAPECMDEKDRGKNVGRSIDVWAMGCLMAETITYMTKGPVGVETFQERRLSKGRLPGWTDSGFYTPDGKLKQAVTDWLNTLSETTSTRSLVPAGIKVIFKCLNEVTHDRPQISTVLEDLTVLSLKAHFSAILETFTGIQKRPLTQEIRETPHDSQQYPTNEMWFLQHRLLAWGCAIGLDKDHLSSVAMSRLMDIHDQVSRVMLALSQRLDDVKISAMSDPDLQRIFEKRVNCDLDSLWSCLGNSELRRAEDYWRHCILNTNDIGLLDFVRQHLPPRYPIHDITQAMATMRKIRVAMTQPELINIGESEGLLIQRKDIQITAGKETYGRHVTGIFQGRMPVLIEWMWYNSNWQKIDVQQRSLVMRLRAQSFVSSNKPDGLRTLNCMGVFEETGGRMGYGFVYEIPHRATSTMRLVDVLEQAKDNSKAQPILGDKFQLAAALAGFMKEFHTAGWLHESFNSHNIIFFTESYPNKGSDQEIRSGTVSLLSSKTMREPYVVGLHKSRPDGEAWQTEGPAQDGDRGVQEYHHPEYALTGRYQPSYDYYSLGIVLMEIGLWHPLQSLISSERHQDMTLAQIRQALIKLCQARLGAKMGEVYRDVVIRCIDGSLGDGQDGSVVFRNFMDRVAEPLAMIASTPL